MTAMKTAMMKAAMSGFYHTGAHRLLAPYTQGEGMIFSLHHVRPDIRPAREREFAPNRNLEVSPEFLEAVLDQVEEAGLDVVSLDEAVRRLRHGEGRRFVCFTFDDGYRDVFTHAYPIFKRRSLPLTIYVPTDYASGRGELWWLALEEIVRRADEIELCRHRDLWCLPTVTAAEKSRSHDQIYWWLRAIDEATQRQIVRSLAERYEIDMAAMCRDLVMNWDELRLLAADPLVTIGTHGQGHYAMAKLSTEKAVSEMEGSADAIERELGTRPTHLSFPYGDEDSTRGRDFALAKELGFRTGVTTRKGVLFPGHCRNVTALPRVALNGDYQSLTYTALYLSGAPFALWNGLQQVRAA
ncbi:MAG: polysaccharide deacetylase family protein [Methyloceanibacter sp.]